VLRADHEMRLSLRYWNFVRTLVFWQRTRAVSEKAGPGQVAEYRPGPGEDRPGTAAYVGYHTLAVMSQKRPGRRARPHPGKFRGVADLGGDESSETIATIQHGRLRDGRQHRNDAL
jgi:hypothetical protein